MSTWMSHPRLAEDQVIEVPDAAVDSHRRAGWEVTERPQTKQSNPQIEAAESPGTGVETDDAEADDIETSGNESPDELDPDPDTENTAVDERHTDTTQDGKE